MFSSSYSHHFVSSHGQSTYSWFSSSVTFSGTSFDVAASAMFALARGTMLPASYGYSLSVVSSMM